MKISFPAMHGRMGNRDFYVTMVKLNLIPKIFSFHDWTELPPEQRAQRVLQKGRIPEIAKYILDNEDGYLFSSLTASFNGDENFRPSSESDDIGILELPLDSQFVINDGQHRMAAIMEALKQNAGLGNETISVVLFPFEDLDRMQQMFSDLNRTVKVTSKSLNILYDHRDLLAQVVLTAIERVSLFKNLVDKDRVSLPLRSPKLFTLSAIYDASRELIGDVTPENQDIKGGMINDYWEAVGANIRQWRQVQTGEIRPSELRAEYINSHAVILWGLGVMGESLIEKYPMNWQSKLVRLAEIDWRRTSKEWQGICMQGTDIITRMQTRKDSASLLKYKMNLPLTPSEKRSLEMAGFEFNPSPGKPDEEQVEQFSNRNRGKDLSLEFISLLEKQGIPFKILEKRGQSPKVVMIDQKKCLIHYSNLTNDRYWFGFGSDDFENKVSFNFVILLCGHGSLVSEFIVPFETFREFALKGNAIGGNRYHVSIFPKLDNIMKAPGNREEELKMNEYDIRNLGEFFR